MNFDPRSPEFRANPYPYYERLRANAPIFFWEEWGIWFLSRHSDCHTLLRDNRLGNNPGPGASMLFQNPPDHTRLRSLVHKAFTPRIIQQFRDQIQKTTDRLLDQTKESGQLDIVADLAYPLPVIVIAEMMGIPPEDHIKFHQWARALVQTLDLSRDEVADERASEAVDAFEEYFETLFDTRRSQPTDDLLSALVAAEEAGDKLSELELHRTARLLLIAGFETTVGLISNGTWALFSHPEQMQLLQNQPNLIDMAVEELLRYDSPIQLVGRTALEDVEYNGVIFEQGQSVNFMLGAANRDPAIFSRPHTLDVMRQPNPHLAFSSGIHYCLGAPLARLEAQIAINTLLRRMPNLTPLIDNVTYRDNYVFRGIESLPVAIKSYPEVSIG